MRVLIPLAFAIAFILRHQRARGRPSFAAYGVTLYLLGVWFQAWPWFLLP